MKLTKFASACAALLLVPALASCSSDSQSTSTPTSATASPDAGNAVAPLPTGGAELADTSWELSGLASVTGSVSDLGITLEFTADQASGKGGVNTYSAGYTSAADGSLKFDQIAATSMAGDQAAMDAETEYFATLQSVTGYSINGGLLDLFVGPDQVMTYTSAS